jgi:tellurite methyltransferase
MTVLDLGCGEGKNAVRLAEAGCHVEAWDISEAGLANAQRTWPNARVSWFLRDTMTLAGETRKFDIIVAYGLLHCLKVDAIESAIRSIQAATTELGFNLTVCFNCRTQLNSARQAHPGFQPSLLPHQFYVDAYQAWELLYNTDENISEQHPNNNIPHTHSLTRILARKRSII